MAYLEECDKGMQHKKCSLEKQSLLSWKLVVYFFKNLNELNFTKKGKKLLENKKKTINISIFLLKFDLERNHFP